VSRRLCNKLHNPSTESSEKRDEPLPCRPKILSHFDDGHLRRSKICRAEGAAREVVRETEGQLCLRSINGVRRRSVKNGDIDHYDGK
jgi:hypothetical protein